MLNEALTKWQKLLDGDGERGRTPCSETSEIASATSTSLDIHTYLRVEVRDRQGKGQITVSHFIDQNTRRWLIWWLSSIDSVFIPRERTNILLMI